MRFRPIILAGLVACLAGDSQGADALDEAIRRARLDYTKQLETATQSLNRTREAIAAEEAPLARSAQELQNRIVALENELAQLESGRAQAGETLGRLQRDHDSLKRNLNYITSQSHDALKGLADSLLPGEALLLNDRLKPLQDMFENQAKAVDAPAALAALDVFTDHLTRATGGYLAPGASLVGHDNLVRQGTFAYVGPEVFFRSVEGDLRGVVQLREGGGLHPMTHPLSGWKKDQADLFFQQQLAVIPSDSTAGKALRLQETSGTFPQHVRKGGFIAYVIIGVGLLSLVIMIMKVRDARNLRVDEPARVRRILQLVAAGKEDEAGHLVPALQAATRELFTTGLQHSAKSRDLLEDHLFSFIQQQRLHFERRLPLLTVIATASPLLGLLGTVMGMVKTFALITVFGTGNAAKLSSGISEVLVATELGLAVAIPTLVVHGFLSHHIQKKLGLLEQYASEFVAAAEESPTGALRSRTP